MLSRQVLEVTIPPGVQPLSDPYSNFVDMQIAAPYGVSSHMLVPLITHGVVGQRFAWATQNAALDIWYKAGPPAAASTITFGSVPEILVSGPLASASVTVSIVFTLSEASPSNGLVLGTWTATARLDAQRQRYVIDGTYFNALAGNLITAAGTSFGMVAPTPNSQARWLLRGSIGASPTLIDAVQGNMVLDVTFRQIQ